jgi:uncharacterized membrane protein
MILMVVDHASMAFDGNHERIAVDSVTTYVVGAPLPAWDFLVRWAAHICAPTFVFLAGSALAISVERKVARAEPAWNIDRFILERGFIIALMDPTIISLATGRLTFQVLFAIGVGMMLMVPLRRLSTPILLLLGFGWLAMGELITSLMWEPTGPGQWPETWVAVLFATKQGADWKTIYPIVPWLSMMVLGWVFGRYMLEASRPGADRLAPKYVMLLAGLGGIGLFAVVRWINDYGNMFLLRANDSLVQWLHVSKYPPSLSFTALELGLMCMCLSLMLFVESRVKTNRDGLFLVFGQTAMFFYLVHRLTLETLATWGGMRGMGDLSDALWISAMMLLWLYPMCHWYRDLKARHPESFLRYL